MISGISLGVVVVEAAERSGSLITARLPANNNLPKQGACLVTSSRDIVATLAPILGRSHPGPTGLAAGGDPKGDPPPNPVMSNRLIFAPIDVQPPGPAASAEAAASGEKATIPGIS